MEVETRKDGDAAETSSEPPAPVAVPAWGAPRPVAPSPMTGCE